MKTRRNFLLGLFSLAALIAFCGCESAGYVGVDEGVYYGPAGDPWFHEGPWVYGQPWHGESHEMYIHPPRPAPRPAPRAVEHRDDHNDHGAHDDHGHR